MKYIRFEHAGFVIFEDTQSHKDIAKNFPEDKPMSAGFVSYCEWMGPACHGNSMGLSLSCDSKDTEWLRRSLEP